MGTPLIRSLIAIVILASVIEGANILGFLPSSGRSHFKPFEILFFKLAERGHNVTVVSQFPMNEKIANYTHIELKNVKIEFLKLGFANLRKQNRLQNWICMHEEIQRYAVEIGRLPQVQNLIKSNDTKFDLVFLEHYHSDGLLALGYRFNCPVIGLSFQTLLPQYHWIKGNPATYSYIPHLFLPYTDTMNFWERLTNSVFGMFTIIFYRFSSISWHQKQVNVYLEGTNVAAIPRFEDLLPYLSLIFVESHFSAAYTRPSLPNIVDVAGIHIEQEKKLPQDLHDFMEDAENGIIYVSLGTLIEPNLTNELGLKFMNIFQRIPYRVIWKWKQTKLTQNISKNVMVREWLPQIDILRHPKCKLFISHGGYHSLLETIHSGVPILGLPFFTDQHYNTAIIEKFLIGKKASPETREEELENIIAELLTNNKYTKNAQKQSKLFADRPRSPMNTAIYWTEYVLRHKGVSHLNSAATELYWFQYLLLDVILLFLIIFCGLFYAFTKCTTKCYRRVSKIRFSSQNQTNKLKRN